MISDVRAATISLPEVQRELQESRRVREENDAKFRQMVRENNEAMMREVGMKYMSWVFRTGLPGRLPGRFCLSHIFSLIHLRIY